MPLCSTADKEQATLLLLACTSESHRVVTRWRRLAPYVDTAVSAALLVLAICAHDIFLGPPVAETALEPFIVGALDAVSELPLGTGSPSLGAASFA